MRNDFELLNRVDNWRHGVGTENAAKLFMPSVKK